MSESSVLLVLTGESYRSGGQCTRTRGTGDYVKRQLLASISHGRFIDIVREKGCTLDIAINTYALNEVDDTQLLNFYKTKGNVVLSIFHKQIFPSETDYLNQMYDSIQPHMDKYEYVILLRMDFFLKDYFFKIFTLYNNKIQFSHIDSAMNISHNIIHNVNHCFIIIPKKFYTIIKDKLIYSKTHHMYKDLRVKGFVKEDFHFMVNTLHICSTDLGWNPLYIQVGRSYNSTYNQNNYLQATILHYYNELNDSFMFDPSNTTERWQSELYVDSLEENLKKLPVERFEDLRTLWTSPYFRKML